MAGILGISRRNERIFHERHSLSTRHFYLCSELVFLFALLDTRPIRAQEAHAKATDTWVGTQSTAETSETPKKIADVVPIGYRELLQVAKSTRSARGTQWLSENALPQRRLIRRTISLPSVGKVSLSASTSSGHLGDIFVPIHPANDIFVPIHPANGDDLAPVKVWEIRYPPDIETDDTYLATELERRDGD